MRKEGVIMKTYKMDAVEYIAKLSDGGMRDALSFLDKCLAYNPDLTLENVVAALGTVDYDIMIALTHNIIHKESKSIIEIIENIHAGGKELKTFLRQYVQFLLDVSKYGLGCDWKYISLPRLEEYEKWMKALKDDDYEDIENLLTCLIHLNSNIKYSSMAKMDIQTALLLFIKEEK